MTFSSMWDGPARPVSARGMSVRSMKHGFHTGRHGFVCGPDRRFDGSVFGQAHVLSPKKVQSGHFLFLPFSQFHGDSMDWLFLPHTNPPPTTHFHAIFSTNGPASWLPSQQEYYHHLLPLLLLIRLVLMRCPNQQQQRLLPQYRLPLQ